MRAIKFLGIKWNKEDLKALSFVVAEGLRANLANVSTMQEEQIQKMVENIKEINE